MSAGALPPYVSREIVAERLPLIFPEGTPHRRYCIRDLAASTVFVLIYIGAVAGRGVFLAPKHVYRMTDRQAAKANDAARGKYANEAVMPGFAPRGRRWYADNTREPIRDETLREGIGREWRSRCARGLADDVQPPTIRAAAELCRAVRSPARGQTL